MYILQVSSMCVLLVCADLVCQVWPSPCTQGCWLINLHISIKKKRLNGGECLFNQPLNNMRISPSYYAITGSTCICIHRSVYLAGPACKFPPSSWLYIVMMSNVIIVIVLGIFTDIKPPWRPNVVWVLTRILCAVSSWYHAFTDPTI